MVENKIERGVLPDLVGTRFVKSYTAFLVDAAKNGKSTKEDLVLIGFRDKGVKPRTTKRYIRELIELGILNLSPDGYLLVNCEEDNSLV
jgi:hypothetical protein